MSKNIR